MRIIFCGTRHNISQFREKIIKVLNGLNPEEDVIIHGNCSGVDKMTDAEARKRGFRVEFFDADWRRHGRAAGPIRNTAMLDSGVDKVYAFPYPTLEKSRGTRDMVRKVEKKGIEIEIFELKPNISMFNK